MVTQLLPDQSQIDSHPDLTADEEDAEEERGPRTGRKRLVNSKFKPSMRGKGGIGKIATKQKLLEGRRPQYSHTVT